MSLQDRVTAKAEERRWLILGVLCFSLLVIVLDNSILNVALPTIVRELDATNSQLQWMVDSYTLVFAGLLLTAGSLGDRFGRRPALQFGFVVFGIGSLLSALAGSADQLIATRAFMGIGGAFIMPATLSSFTNVFPARERGKAIGVWAATAGVAVALGPLTGGFLLEHFYWGSIFLVNIPIVVFGVIAGVYLIPNSKDPAAPPLDPVGAVLSIAGLSSLLYAIIEGPDKGWTADSTLLFFGIGAAIITAFFVWEVRSDHPMLDLTFFKNPRFSMASGAIMVTFFAMFGSIFVLTQYLQFVLGYTPLETGVRLLAFAIPMMILAPMSARFVERLGAKVVVASGLTLVATGLLLSLGLDQTSSYGSIAWRMVIMASGMALTMAPATDSIMGSLPLAKAGVGSAVNDTTRQIGGAVGVAVVGSVFASIYGSKVSDAFSANGVPSGAIDSAKDSLGAALAIAAKAPSAVSSTLADAARGAFVDGFHAGLYVGAGVALLGAIGVILWLPARARREDIEQQHAEYDATQQEMRDAREHARVEAGESPDGTPLEPVSSPSRP
jgi:EmrB/QacA subfamily drug resistance transporter